MDIGSVGASSYVVPSQAIQSGSTLSAASNNTGGDSGRIRGHHGHGGGMRDALMQALQSLGLSDGQSGTDSSNDASASQVGNDGADGGSQAQSVKGDMRNFMRALFQAIKGESDGATTSVGAGGPTGQAHQDSFAGGLSALITQVSSGSAPAGLQSAFNTLVADLQPGGSTASNAVGGAKAASSVSLTQLLT
jgi:hypothetical protein